MKKSLYSFLWSTILISFIFLIGCNGKIREENGRLKSENSQLKEKVSRLENEIKSLKSLISELQLTDNYYYQMGLKYREKESWEESNKYFKQLIEKFPKSTLVGQAEKFIQENNKAILRKKCDLELISLTSSIEDYGIIGMMTEVKGQVKNISDRTLKDVWAVAELYDKNGNFLDFSQAQINLNPFYPGHISPFHVTIPSPGAKISVKFQFFSGQIIPSCD